MRIRIEDNSILNKTVGNKLQEQELRITAALQELVALQLKYLRREQKWSLYKDNVRDCEH